MAKKVRILSLDGGGIRGVIPASVLAYVEAQLIQKTNNPNARIADYFDMIVGTSTGGILGCFYLTPAPAGSPVKSKYKASQGLDFYIQKGAAIFTEAKRNSWFGLRQLINATRFSPDNIEKIFREEFGDLKYSELLKPCIVTCFDMKSQNAVFFNSRERSEKKREYFLCDVARSTSAAPTYFPPAFIKNLITGDGLVNIDGGVFANNPALCAYAEARTADFGHISNPTADDMLMLSIGTGGGALTLGNLDKSGTWGVTEWAKNIPDIMMMGSLDTVNYQMARLYEAVAPQNRANYKRVNVPLDKRYYNSDMSDASPNNLQALRSAGQAAIESANIPEPNQFTLDQFIDKLIENA